MRLALALDPQDIKRIHWVIKYGRPYEAATRSEIWSRQRTLPHGWWQQTEDPSMEGQ